MIILNSVSDFKSFFIKTILNFKGLTYVNLEYAENNNLDYSLMLTTLVYINSPINDSERMITKKIKSLIKIQETKKNNIYVSENENNYSRFLKKDVVLKDPYVIIRFLQDLCYPPSLYPTSMEKRLFIHINEKDIFKTLFEHMYNFEKNLLIEYGGNNGYNFKKILKLKQISLGNEKVKIEFNKIVELLSFITKIIIKNINSKYFFYDNLNPIELLFYCFIDRLFQYNLINNKISLNSILLKKYNLIKKELLNQDSDHKVVDYQNLDLSKRI